MPRYAPGDLTVVAEGFLLSTGLGARVVATSGERVVEGGRRFHARPDAGACFARGDGGWIYVSNSESADADDGGVGAIVFDADGGAVDSGVAFTKATAPSRNTPEDSRGSDPRLEPLGEGDRSLAESLARVERSSIIGQNVGS